MALALAENPRKVDAAPSDDDCGQEHAGRRAPEHLAIRLTSRVSGSHLVRTPDASSSSALRRAVGASTLPRRFRGFLDAFGGPAAGQVRALLQVFRC
ncbi:hypothetical protein [Actinomadura roseirufa]|uniref:hypothetical protein n=1 Tax=Actinomadura roseirufa TaxID=2094049 RepID=UPI001040FE3A|nr:hypothetical protein [Actinomadura roseirufa]